MSLCVVCSIMPSSRACQIIIVVFTAAAAAAAAAVVVSNAFHCVYQADAECKILF